MRTNPLADPHTITCFGKNIYACCSILGISIKSLGVRADVDSTLFPGYLAGTQTIREEDLEAVRSEFRLTKLQIVTHYGTEEQRKKALTSQLASAGHVIPKTIPAGSELHEDDTTGNDGDTAGMITDPAEQVPPATDVLTGTNVAEIVVQETITESTEAASNVTVRWNDEDLVAETADGQKFNMCLKGMRAGVIGQIREHIVGTGWTFAKINDGAKINKPSS